jgi:hypothetical protein
MTEQFTEQIIVATMAEPQSGEAQVAGVATAPQRGSRVGAPAPRDN